MVVASKESSLPVCKDRNNSLPAGTTIVIVTVDMDEPKNHTVEPQNDNEVTAVEFRLRSSFKHSERLRKATASG